jgi:hypothetical protein
MRLFGVAFGLFTMVAGGATSFVSSLPALSQELFNESMAWMDTFYDPDAGYLHDLSAQTALDHETRSSAWYALGLLARNENDDAQEADKIIINIIGGQFRNESQQWYLSSRTAYSYSHSLNQVRRLPEISRGTSRR